ncbi:hypothetical protein [Geodermatophilus chilensis]|jgi:hypothetical protein|uniref:hypothetical protein n=1 Tax=Geodermatophilus chilensis TaxID=2035835 RepID=UPI0012FFDFEE|nr:hypothetical protein [Geodermatophilus chilensis]
MDTLTAPHRPRTVPAAEPCVAGDIGPERREIECEPLAEPAPAGPSPAPAPTPAAPAPA